MNAKQCVVSCFHSWIVKTRVRASKEIFRLAMEDRVDIFQFNSLSFFFPYVKVEFL